MKPENELKVVVAQEFTVPVEKLYEAWTSEEQLKQWWKPMGKNLVEVTNDLTEGGMVKYVFEQNQMVISGTYSTVKQNELLEYTWDWEMPDDPVKNSSYKLKVHFAATGTGSSIEVTQDAFLAEEGLLPHEEGWKNGLNQLREFLQNKQG